MLGPLRALGPCPPPLSSSLSRNQAPAGCTHTARRGSGCGSGSQACSPLGRCRSPSPQASPRAAPEPGAPGARGGTKRGLCPPGPSSGWQGAGSRQHRAAAGTGPSGLPDMGCFPGARGLQRQKRGRGEEAAGRHRVSLILCLPCPPPSALHPPLPRAEDRLRPPSPSVLT